MAKSNMVIEFDTAGLEHFLLKIAQLTQRIEALEKRRGYVRARQDRGSLLPSESIKLPVQWEQEPPLNEDSDG